MLPIEADLFGAEQWSPAMFWNELANGHHYLVATRRRRRGARLRRARRWRRRTRRGCRTSRSAGTPSAAASAGPLLEALLAEAARRGAPQHPAGGRRGQRAGPAALRRRTASSRSGVRRGYYQPSNTDALVMRRDARTD